MYNLNFYNVGLKLTYISEIFPDAENFLGSGYGWITIFSEHPYYVAYTTLENKHDSISFEHGI